MIVKNADGSPESKVHVVPGLGLHFIPQCSPSGEEGCHVFILRVELFIAVPQLERVPIPTRVPNSMDLSKHNYLGLEADI